MRVAIVLAFVLVATIAPATCQAPWWRGQAIKRLGQGQQQFRPKNQWMPPQDPEAAQEMRERMAEQAEQDAEDAEELREQEEERAQELQEQQAEAAQQMQEQQAEGDQQDAWAAQGMQQQELTEEEAEAAEDLRERQAEAAEAEAEAAQNMQQQEGETAQELAEQEAEAAQEMAEQEAEAEEAEAEAEGAEELNEQQAEEAEDEAEALEELQEQEAEAAEAEAEAREEMQGEEAEGAGIGAGQSGSAGTSFSLGGSQYPPSMGGGSAGPSFFDPTGGFGGSGGFGGFGGSGGSGGYASYGGSSYRGHQGSTGGSNGVPGGAIEGAGGAGGAGGSPGDVPGGGNIGVNGAATGGVPTGAANGTTPNGAANSGTNDTTNGAANGAAPNGAANSATSGAASNGTANGTTGAAGSNGLNGNGGVGSQGTAGSSQVSTSTWTSSAGAEGIGQSIGSSFAGSTNLGAPNEPNIAFAPAPLAQAADAQLTPAETAALDNTYMDKHLCGGFMGANGISGKKDLAVLALDYAGMKQALDPCNVPKNGRTTGRTPVNIAFRTGMETQGQDPASSVLRDLPGMIQRYQKSPIKVHLFSWYTPSEHALRSLLTKKRRGGLVNAEVVLGYVEESKMALFSALLGDTTFTNLLGQLQQAGIGVNRVCDTCSQIANLTSWQRKRQGLANGVGVFDQQAGQCGPVAEVPATDQLALSAPQCQSFQESMGSCIFGKLTAACPWLRHAQAASEQPLAATMQTWSTECGKNLACWQGKGAYLSFLARSAASCRVSQYGASAAIGQCVGAGQNTPLDPAPAQPSL